MEENPEELLSIDNKIKTITSDNQTRTRIVKQQCQILLKPVFKKKQEKEINPYAKNIPHQENNLNTPLQTKAVSISAHKTITICSIYLHIFTTHIYTSCNWLFFCNRYFIMFTIIVL